MKLLLCLCFVAGLFADPACSVEGCKCTKEKNCGCYANPTAKCPCGQKK